jgi:phosphonate transport system ATP-binding protein
MIDKANAFELERVSVQYRSVTALDDVSLRIVPGEQVALVGPSGAGKTTLLRLLNGSIRPTSGRVLVQESDTRQLSTANLRRLRSQIGFVHQDLSLVPNLRVVQNVVSGGLGRASLFRSLRMMLLPSHAETSRAYDLLARVGIEEKLYQRTDRLSGGQQQRVAIARALYQQPTSILADEPVSSVDPARALSAVKLLTEISREDGLTLCMSLHNLDLAREFFPRLIGMRHGQVMFDSSADDLADDEFQRLYQLSEEELLDDKVGA